MMRLPPNGCRLTSIICITLHSMFTGDSRTPGGRTNSLGTGVKPPIWNSSTPASYSPEVRFIRSAISSVTMLTTNSPFARTFVKVSFGGSRTPHAKHMTGGFAQITLKKLNGARLRTPSGETVETNAMGRGTTVPISSLYVLIGGVAAGSTLTLSGINTYENTGRSLFGPLKSLLTQSLIENTIYTGISRSYFTWSGWW